MYKFIIKTKIIFELVLFTYVSSGILYTLLFVDRVKYDVPSLSLHNMNYTIIVALTTGFISLYLLINKRKRQVVSENKKIILHFINAFIACVIGVSFLTGGYVEGSPLGGITWYIDYFGIYTVYFAEFGLFLFFQNMIAKTTFGFSLAITCFILYRSMRPFEQEKREEEDLLE